MSRTKGSGWGAGPLLYQICPKCGKKKAFYNPIPGAYVLNFRCTNCKEQFASDSLIRWKYGKENK